MRAAAVEAADTNFSSSLKSTAQGGSASNQRKIGHVEAEHAPEGRFVTPNP